MNFSAEPCPACNGARINPELRALVKRLGLVDEVANPGGRLLCFRTPKGRRWEVQLGDCCDSCDLKTIQAKLHEPPAK